MSSDRTNPHDEWEVDCIHALMEQRGIPFPEAYYLFTAGTQPEPCPPEPLPRKCYKQ